MFDTFCIVTYKKMGQDFLDKIHYIFRENEYILGYELINEPWCGDIFEEPDLLIPGREREREIVCARVCR